MVFHTFHLIQRIVGCVVLRIAGMLLLTLFVGHIIRNDDDCNTFKISEALHLPSLRRCKYVCLVCFTHTTEIN